MIVGLIGEVLKIEPTSAQINAHGVVYEVQMSLNATTALRAKLDKPDSKNTPSPRHAHIICTQIIREDAHLLFGFCDELEKRTFERLIKINGVGPKVALAILSTYTPTHFAKIITDKDIDALKKVPGIGAKGAGKIMVDVAGFFAELVQSSLAPQDNNLKSEAALALQSLGFKSSEIDKVLAGLEAQNVSELVKQALKKLA